MNILYKKYMAAVVIFAVSIVVLSPFANVFAADPDSGDDPAQSDQYNQDGQDNQDNQADEKTEIKSVIPYVDKTENGITQPVPIESREDMSLGQNSLKIQVYVNAEDAQKYSDSKYGSQIYIFKLKPYEEITDINKESSSPTTAFPIVQNSSEGFSYGVTLLTPELRDFRSGEIFNKFVVAVKDGDKYVPISDAKYISNINYLSNKRDTPPVSKTKKGLSIQMLGEARMLGVGYTTVNMILNDFMAAEQGPNTELYVYGGENFYFNIDKISEYDKKIKFLTNEGINVTAVLLISARGFTPAITQDSQNNQDNQDEQNGGGGDDPEGNTVPPESLVPVDPVEYLIHPNALASAQSGPDKAFYYGINTTDERGVKCFEALMSFIADRYVKEDIGHGRINNVILGSDIGETLLFNNCGKIDIVSYVKDYMRALRICDTAMRSRFGGSRVYAPISNFFLANSGRDGDFVNRDIIDYLCYYSRKEGNFIWNIAVKPYNIDILAPEYWKESVPLNDFSTPVITMKNIEVLCNYLNLEKKDYLPDGEIRKIMISDLGYSSGDNSKENMEMQAAAFVSAYLKARSIPDITAFIYHGHVDNKNEIGSLGLWTNLTDTVNEPGDRKKIYDVFKYMDTNRESEKIDFAKLILGAEDEIAKYSKETEPAVILKEAVGETLKSRPNATYIGSFGDDRLSGFIGSSNIIKMNRVIYENKESANFNGAGALFAGFATPSKGDFVGIFKIYTAEEPTLNLTGEKYVGVRLRLDTSIQLPQDQMIQLILIMESESAVQSSGVIAETGGTASPVVQSLGNTAKTISVFEGLANISPNKDEIIYFDISSWEDRGDIKKIKLLVNPYLTNYSGQPDDIAGNSVDIIGNPDASGEYDFNLYVFSIVSARYSRMSGVQTFFTVIFIILLIAGAGYGVLYIRARIIKKKRREMRRQRELQKRRAKAAANRSHAHGTHGMGMTGQNNMGNRNINRPPNSPPPTQRRPNPGENPQRGMNRGPPNNRGNGNNTKR